MHLVILSDDLALRDQLRSTLGDSACEFHPADPNHEGLVLALSREPDAVLLDLAGANGRVAGWITGIQAQTGRSPLLVILPDGSREAGLSALKAGATDYLSRPLSLDELAVRLRRSQETEHLRRELLTLRNQLERQSSRSLIVAESAPLTRLRERLGVLGASNEPILLVGERGNGKKALAEYVHRMSGQRRAPSTVIQIRHLRPPLLGSREWQELRDAGTVILEHLDALSSSDQAALAGALQAHRDSPGNHPMPRVVATTERRLDLPECRQGFAEDLMRQFGEQVFLVPPLRERPADIPALLAHFAQRTAHRLGRSVSISPRALAMLTVYPWPGNVAELEAAMERAATLGGGGRLEYADFGLVPGLNGNGAAENQHGALELKPQVEAFERQVLLQALSASKGNRQAAARLLGISLRTLFYKIKRYQVD